MSAGFESSSQHRVAILATIYRRLGKFHSPTNHSIHREMLIFPDFETIRLPA
jgi:hypothetical protein